LAVPRDGDTRSRMLDRIYIESRLDRTPSLPRGCVYSGNGKWFVKSERGLTSRAILESNSHALHCKWQSEAIGAMSDRSGGVRGKASESGTPPRRKSRVVTRDFSPQLFPSASASQMRPIERLSQLPVALAGNSIINAVD